MGKGASYCTVFLRDNEVFFEKDWGPVGITTLDTAR
jgi:hypothetical protein